MLRAILLVSLCAAAALAQTFTCQVAANCPTLPCRTLRDCNNNVCRYRATAGCCVTPNDCPDSLTDPCALPTCVNNVCGFELCPNTPTCATVCNAVLGDVNFGHCIGANGCCNTAEDCAAPAVENICAVMECVANQCVEVKEPGCCETVADCPPNACGPSECPQEGLLANHCVAPGTCCFPTIEAAALAADPNFPAGDTCNEDNFGPCDLITGCDALTGRCTTVKEEGCCETQAECDGLPCEAICVTDPLSALANHCIVSNTAPAGCCNLLDDCEPNVCQGEATACTLNRCEFAPNPDPLCCIVASDCPVTACNVALGGASCTIDNHCVPAPGCCFSIEDCADPAVGTTMACSAEGRCVQTPIPNFCLTAATCPRPVDNPCIQATCTANLCGTAAIPGCQRCSPLEPCPDVACRTSTCSAAGVCTLGPLVDATAPTGTVSTNPAGAVAETGRYISVTLNTAGITDNCGGPSTCTITNIVAADTNINAAGSQRGSVTVGTNCAGRTGNLFNFAGATATVCASANRAAGRLYTFTVRCADQTNNARQFTTTLTVTNTIAANEGDQEAVASGSLSVGSIGVIAGVAIFVVVVAVVTILVVRSSRGTQAASAPRTASLSTVSTV